MRRIPLSRRLSLRQPLPFDCKREEAIDDRLCNDLYNLECLSTSFRLHMTDSLFCTLSKNFRLIFSERSLFLHLVYLQYTV